MKILDNSIERDATQEEEAYFQEQLELLASAPKPLGEQIEDVEQQVLDVAEAVTSMFETLLGVTA